MYACSRATDVANDDQVTPLFTALTHPNQLNHAKQTATRTHPAYCSNNMSASLLAEVWPKVALARRKQDFSPLRNCNTHAPPTPQRPTS